MRDVLRQVVTYVTLEVKLTQDLSLELFFLEHRSWCQFRGFRGQVIQYYTFQVCRIGAGCPTSSNNVMVDVMT